MSKMLNGPPGSPLGLCSGTSITSINPICPFCAVPQTGQPDGLLPQLFKKRSIPHSAMRSRRGTILVFIRSPPTISAKARSKPKLKSLEPDIVIVGQNALYAWIPEPIQTQFRFDENPVVEIPVHSHRELIGVIGEPRGDDRRDRAGGDGCSITRRARRIPLEPGVAELDRPGTPTRSPRFSWRSGTDNRVPNPRQGVQRIGLSGQEIDGRNVKALTGNGRLGVESDAAGRQ